MIQSFPGDIVKSVKVGEDGFYPELTVLSVVADDMILVSDGKQEWKISWYTVFMRIPKGVKGEKK